MHKELVATDCNHRDECHELLEVALGVAVGVQALHQAVECCLVFHVLNGQTEKFTSGCTKRGTIKVKMFWIRVDLDCDHDLCCKFTKIQKELQLI